MSKTTYFDSKHSRFDNEVWRDMNKNKLSHLQMCVFLYLNHNDKVAICGLYKLNLWEMMKVFSLDEVEAIKVIRELEKLGFLVYDNELIYVPFIKDRQGFAGRSGTDRYWRSKVRAALGFALYPSEFDGVNRAYLAYQNGNTLIIAEYYEEQEKLKNRRFSGGDSHSDHVSSGDSHSDHVSGSDSHSDHVSSGDSHSDHTSSGDSHSDHVSSGDSHSDHVSSGDSHSDHTSSGDSRSDDGKHNHSPPRSSLLDKTRG